MAADDDDNESGRSVSDDSDLFDCTVDSSDSTICKYTLARGLPDSPATHNKVIFGHKFSIFIYF